METLDVARAFPSRLSHFIEPGVQGGLERPLIPVLNPGNSIVSPLAALIR
jgi:hypothetical protein